jgi:hypothetical protein
VQLITVRTNSAGTACPNADQMTSRTPTLGDKAPTLDVVTLEMVGVEGIYALFQSEPAGVRLAIELRSKR